MAEIFVVTDIEADGPIPGPYSMLSFGSAAHAGDGRLVDTFSANLETLPGAGQHPKTMEFWASEPEAWAAHRTNPEPPEKAMSRFTDWLEGLPGEPVFAAYPVGFDFTFVSWYLVRFTGACAFKHTALDMRTLAWALTDLPFNQSAKPNLPGSWFSDRPHTHVALDDALEHGDLFVSMLAALRAQKAS